MMMARRILVVDDDAQMVRTLCDILALHGWAPEGCTDAARAVAAVEQAPYDAVVMDVLMPGINGVQAFRAMRRARPGLRVVLMTAFAASDLLMEAEREGVNRIFPKPFEVSSLVEAVA